jgi:hypothetical protein
VQENGDMIHFLNFTAPKIKQPQKLILHFTKTARLPSLKNSINSKLPLK